MNNSFRTKKKALNSFFGKIYSEIYLQIPVCPMIGIKWERIGSVVQTMQKGNLIASEFIGKFFLSDNFLESDSIENDNSSGVLSEELAVEYII